MSLLIPTNSLDGSADVLIHLCEEDEVEVLRFNVDRWDEYEVNVTADSFEIADGYGRVFTPTGEGSLVLFRKPFLESIVWPEERHDRAILQGQLRGFLQCLITEASSAGKLALIEPYAERRLPKLRQLIDASRYLTTPGFRFGFQRWDGESGRSYVTKTLDRMDTSDGKMFFTAKVTPSELEWPYPWLIQDAKIAGSDVTCVYIDGETRFYACDFDRTGDVIDWRVEIHQPGQSPWHAHETETTREVGASVTRLMKHWGLHYGRLDFIEDPDGTLWFLECNPNGQFGWLDDSEWTLHRRFLESALSEKCRVHVD